MDTRLLSLGLACALALGAGACGAGAQSPTSAADSAKPATAATVASVAPPAPFLVAHADLGYVSTSGNTNVSTLNFADALTFNASGRNSVAQTFSLVYGTSQNKVQTSLWTGQLEDIYKFTAHVGLYALGHYDRNTFAGIDQRLEEGVGMAVTVVDSRRDHLELSGGVSAIEERSTTDSAGSYAALRTSVLYKHTFFKNTYAQEALDGIPDLKISADYRINSETDLVAPLSKHLAIKIGYGIHYANLPPPGFGTTDRLFTSDIQYNY